MTMASQICKQEEIVYWLMEYSHFYGYNDMDDLWKSYQQPVVYKIAAALEAIVASPHLESFDLAVTLIEHVFTVDPHVCPFKVYSKLLLGIKKKLMMQELHKGHLNVHKLLNVHFPHEGLSYPNQCYKDHAEMKRTVDRFRAFFIPLIYSQYKRWQYFATDYEADFGAGFMNELRGLLTIFLQKLRERLPMPVLEMLLRNQGNRPKSTCPCGHVELLLQYTRGKHRFSVHEIRTIFDEITSLHQCKLPVSLSNNTNSQPKTGSTDTSDQNSSNVISKKHDAIENNTDVLEGDNDMQHMVADLGHKRTDQRIKEVKTAQHEYTYTRASDNDGEEHKCVCETLITRKVQADTVSDATAKNVCIKSSETSGGFQGNISDKQSRESSFDNRKSDVTEISEDINRNNVSRKLHVTHTDKQRQVSAFDNEVTADNVDLNWNDVSIKCNGSLYIDKQNRVYDFQSPDIEATVNGVDFSDRNTISRIFPIKTHTARQSQTYGKVKCLQPNRNKINHRFQSPDKQRLIYVNMLKGETCRKGNAKSTDIQSGGQQSEPVHTCQEEMMQVNGAPHTQARKCVQLNNTDSIVSDINNNATCMTDIYSQREDDITVVSIHPSPEFPDTPSTEGMTSSHTNTGQELCGKDDRDKSIDNIDLINKQKQKRSLVISDLYEFTGPETQLDDLEVNKYNCNAKQQKLHCDTPSRLSDDSGEKMSLADLKQIMKQKNGCAEKKFVTTKRGVMDEAKHKERKHVAESKSPPKQFTCEKFYSDKHSKTNLAIRRKTEYSMEKRDIPVKDCFVLTDKYHNADWMLKLQQHQNNLRTEHFVNSEKFTKLKHVKHVKDKSNLSENLVNMTTDRHDENNREKMAQPRTMHHNGGIKLDTNDRRKVNENENTADICTKGSIRTEIEQTQTVDTESKHISKHDNKEIIEIQKRKDKNTIKHNVCLQKDTHEYPNKDEVTLDVDASDIKEITGTWTEPDSASKRDGVCTYNEKPIKTMQAADGTDSVNESTETDGLIAIPLLDCALVIDERSISSRVLEDLDIDSDVSEEYVNFHKENTVSEAYEVAESRPGVETTKLLNEDHDPEDGEEDPGFLCSGYSHPGCRSIGEGYIHRYSDTSASDIFVLSDSDVGSIVPPSTGDSDINVELDNLADDVEFDDHMCSDTLPDLSRFLHPQPMSRVQ